MCSAYLVLSARTQALWPLPARQEIFFVVVAVDRVLAAIRTSWLPLTRVVHRPCRNSQASQVSQHCIQTPGPPRDPGTAPCPCRPRAPVLSNHCAIPELFTLRAAAALIIP